LLRLEGVVLPESAVLFDAEPDTEPQAELRKVA